MHSKSRPDLIDQRLNAFDAVPLLDTEFFEAVPSRDELVGEAGDVVSGLGDDPLTDDLTRLN